MSSLEPATRERLELETRVLAAALRLSLEYGDTEGSSLAHEQIFRLLKACQEIGETESLAFPASPAVDKVRRMPDIDWFAPTEIATFGDKSADFTPDNSQADNIESGIPVPDQLETAAAPVIETVRSRPLSVELEETIDSLYELLEVGQHADTRSIHLRFLFKLRRMMRYIQAHPDLRGVERKNVLKRLQSYWIAHDILSDSQTRSSYDERMFGSKTSDDDGDDTVSSGALPKPAMRIGELLQTSGLLEKTELEIAADMHKAMPELMFGAFLVKQGFVKEDDLECVLIGQALIKTGELDLAQFQIVMEKRAEDLTIKLSQILVESGLVSAQRVAEVLLTLPVEEVGLADLTPKKESEETAAPAKDPVSLNLKNAVPSWKDQLDWNTPEEEKQELSLGISTSEHIKVLPVQILPGQGKPAAFTGTQTGEVPALPASAASAAAGAADAAADAASAAAAASAASHDIETPVSNQFDTGQLSPLREENLEESPYNSAQFEITSENPVITDEEVVEPEAESTAPLVADADTVSGASLADTLPPPPHSESDDAPRKARKHSLLDLMVDLVTPELKDEVEEPRAEPLLSSVLEKDTGDLDTILFGAAPAEAQESKAQESNVTLSESANSTANAADEADAAYVPEVESEDFEMLTDAVEVIDAETEGSESGDDTGEEDRTPTGELSLVGFNSQSETTGPQPVLDETIDEISESAPAASAERAKPRPRQETAEEVFFGEEDDINDVAHLDMAVDEILELPDPGDVSASEAAALAAAAKDSKVDSWSIVSMPASYLASYLLDDDDTLANGTIGGGPLGNQSGSNNTKPANPGKKHLEPPEDRERGKFRRRKGR